MFLHYCFRANAMIPILKAVFLIILGMSQKIGLKCANKMHKFVLDY